MTYALRLANADGGMSILYLEEARGFLPSIRNQYQPSA